MTAHTQSYYACALRTTQRTHNVIARARYALPKLCLADDRSTLSLALWALSL